MVRLIKKGQWQADRSMGENMMPETKVRKDYRDDKWTDSSSNAIMATRRDEEESTMQRGGGGIQSKLVGTVEVVMMLNEGRRSRLHKRER